MEPTFPDSYFTNIFETNKKNPYKIWQEIKALININTQTKYAPICLQIKDSIVTDSKVIANEFIPLSANPTKWSNKLKQFVGNLPTNCLSVFDHFMNLALKGLTTFSTR